MIYKNGSTEKLGNLELRHFSLAGQYRLFGNHRESPKICESRTVYSRLQTIHEKSPRCEKHVGCEKLASKKCAHWIMRKLTTHISWFDYFLVQLNFIPYRTIKFHCLSHNYCFYCEMVRDTRNLSHKAA